MALKLYYHPLASFCHTALIALYEGGIAFEPVVVDLGDEKSSAAFRAVWPLGKMPVLRDEARNRTVVESTIIIEYLDAYYRGVTRFIPCDPERAWQTRMWDRFYDHYVQEPMQKIRPPDGAPILRAGVRGSTAVFRAVPTGAEAPDREVRCGDQVTEISGMQIRVPTTHARASFGLTGRW
jgi:glutathione S-transferase